MHVVYNSKSQMYILKYVQVMVHLGACKLQEFFLNVKNWEIVKFLQFF